MDPITLKINILKPVSQVWDFYTKPEHITEWNFATPEWVCPKAENDLREGGRFNYRMEAKDGSFGFDYSGVYDEIVPFQLLKYHLDDGRKVEVQFHEIDAEQTEIVQIFEPEGANPVEMQRDGWYKILDNFHKYAENH